MKSRALLFLPAVFALAMTSCGTSRMGEALSEKLAKKEHISLTSQHSIDEAALAALEGKEELEELEDLPSSSPSNAEGIDALGEDFFEEEIGENSEEVSDPLESVNRVIFVFNDKLYQWVLSPFNKGYRKVMPDFLEKGLSNFFSNLRGPTHIVNNLLQGDLKGGAQETGVFLSNTIFGVGGLFKIEESQRNHREDLGQTLGKWGIGNGPYVMWPILGPSSLRDTVGRVGDVYTYPPTYIGDGGTTAVVLVSDRIHSMDSLLTRYRELVESSIEPYEAMRQSYTEYRKGLVTE